MKKLFFLLALGGSALLGTVWFLYSKSIVIINVSSSSFVKPGDPFQDISFYYWTGDMMKEVLRRTSAFTATSDAVCSFIQRWFTIAEEESLVVPGVEVKTVSYSLENDMYVECSHSFLLPHKSILDKWRCLEGLCKTIRHSFPEAKKLFLLSKGDALSDPHIDFSQGIFLESLATQQGIKL